MILLIGFPLSMAARIKPLKGMSGYQRSANLSLRADSSASPNKLTRRRGSLLYVQQA